MIELFRQLSALTSSQLINLLQLHRAGRKRVFASMLHGVLKLISTNNQQVEV
jgi:hypothetical protein